MTDETSVTTFVMGDRLPWADDVPAVEEKGPLDVGVLFLGATRRDCAIRKISALGTTLRGEAPEAPGSEVAIELPTGHRASGTIDWVRTGETGIRFKQPIDMIALINRTLVSQAVERRRMPRVELRCAAHLKFGGVFAPAKLRNISAGGIQLEGEDLPAGGTYVSTFVEGLNIPPGEVVWRKDDLAGIELFEELSWTSIMPWIRDFVRKGAD